MFTTRRSCTTALWTRLVCFLHRCSCGGRIDSSLREHLVVEAPSLSRRNLRRPLLGHSRKCSTRLTLHPRLRRCRRFCPNRRELRKHRARCHRSVRSCARPRLVKGLRHLLCPGPSHHDPCHFIPHAIAHKRPAAPAKATNQTPASQTTQQSSPASQLAEVTSSMSGHSQESGLWAIHHHSATPVRCYGLQHPRQTFWYLYYNYNGQFQALRSEESCLHENVIGHVARERPPKTKSGKSILAKCP